MQYITMETLFSNDAHRDLLVTVMQLCDYPALRNLAVSSWRLARIVGSIDIGTKLSEWKIRDFSQYIDNMKGARDAIAAGKTHIISLFTLYSDDRMTLIKEVVTEDRPRMVKVLLDGPLDQWTDNPVPSAIAHGSFRCVEALIDYCEDWTWRPDNRPLVMTLKMIRRHHGTRLELKYIYLAETLMKHERVSPKKWDDSLRDSARMGYTENLRRCFYRNPRSNWNHVLLVIVGNGHTNALLAMLANQEISRRCRPQAGNNAALMLAIKKDHPEIVEILLRDHRVNLAHPGQQAICYACQCGREEIVRMLLVDPRVRPWKNNNEALLSASREGHARIVKLLLAHGKVNPNVDEGYPLRAAIYRDHTETALVLIRHGCDVTGGRNGALHYALRNKNRTLALELARRSFMHPRGIRYLKDHCGTLVPDDIFDGTVLAAE